MDSNLKLMIDAGFVPPGHEFVKDDPRGKEYGHFRASTMHARIHAAKYSQDGVYEWMCGFDAPEDFRAWARDCT